MYQENNWTNDLTDKYKDNVESLKYYFEDAYKFLKDIESLNAYGFHMGTAVNMHFYFKEHFLFYFRFHPKANLPESPDKFSPDYNLRLKHDALESSPEMFFDPLLKSAEFEKIRSESSGKIESLPHINKSRIESYMVYVYPTECAGKFFELFRWIIAGIAGKDVIDIFKSNRI